jgi:ADP-ribosyl-[dinitrogen reductase] hydrolase
MLSKFQGVVLGAAVGDALSAPAQFVSREVIHEQYDTIREMQGGGWLKLRKGQFSDDTHMMMCVVESIIEEGTFNVEHAITKLLRWYKTRPKGVGATTAGSLTRLSKGETWRTASHRVYALHPEASAGNGALVRSLPIALRYATDFSSLVTHSPDSAAITHADPMATSGVVLLNIMVSHLLQSEEKDPRAYCLERLFGRQDNVWKHIFVEIDYLEQRDLIASGFVVDTLQSALWCFLKTGSFEEALIAAVNCGDDVNSLTAVAGALSGAHYGVESIPARWLDVLEHREALMSFAQRICTLVHQ